jgi:carboxylesterase
MSSPLFLPAALHSPREDRAVIVLHGLCSSSLEVRLFARSVRDRGYRVVTPRIPGYSVAEQDSEAPFERWVEAVSAEVQRLASACHHVHLCGISLGATLALAAAAESQDRVRSLSLISTTLFYDGWNVSRWRFLLPLAYYTVLGRWYSYRETPPYGVKNERVRAWIAGQLARGELSAAGAARIPTSRLREANRLIRHVKRSLPHVTTPMLLIHAREDDVASLANPRYVASRVASTDVRETVLEDTYHMITLDNERDVAAMRTIQFFESVEAARRRPPAHPGTGAHDARSISLWRAK